MEGKKNSPLDSGKSAGENELVINKNNNFISDLQSEYEMFKKSSEENNSNSQNEIGLFKIQTANDWIEQAKARPIPKMLFSEFWHEGEVCILFADTNLGKSILAVQIADSISSGLSIPGFKLEALPQTVLYFDFELTDKQFQNRYSVAYENPYNFKNNLLRVEFNPDSDIPVNLTFEDFLNNSIENAIMKTKAKVLIIDNLTYLRSETEKAKDALPLMKQLKALKNKYNLSLLILAHTPKRDLSKPITRNDLQGSKMLINFCDSCFSIGESFTDKGIRYLKMIKARNTEIIYDADNVIECNICKPNNFLNFEFLNFGRESSHLKVFSDKDKDELENQIIDLLQAETGITAYTIAKKLCNDESKFNSFKVKVTRIVNKHAHNK
ncbi:MAG: AAA family ATPase [Paludibacteraceae bacterium]|nr:AAA family ATPase [Paludibacteraceae bacterium]MBN2788519.1 AAA family ATPase [Paludibacteraceae bacterium]